jgi:hypothetical protein
MPGETGKLFPFNNVGLFSDHFLNKKLPARTIALDQRDVESSGMPQKDFQSVRKIHFDPQIP